MRCSILAGALILMGCSEVDTTRSSIDIETEKNDERSIASQSVSPTVVSLEGFRNHLLTHAGKILVVDLWALWCGHCVAELPHFAELTQRYPNEVHAISLNVDFDADEGSPDAALLKRIGKALTENRVTADNLVCSTPFEEVLASLDLFSLPACLVFSPDLQLYKKLEGDVEYERDVAPLIDALLKSARIKPVTD